MDGWSIGGHWGLGGDGLSSTPSVDIFFVTNFQPSYPVWLGFVMTNTGVGGLVGPAPYVDLLGVGGNLLEGPEAVQHVVAVDRRQGRCILGEGRPNDHGFSHPFSRAQLAKA